MFKIIDEQKDFIIIDKHPGIEYHGECGIVQNVRAIYPDSLGVHRLDRETSGLMIFALSKQAQIQLSSLFEKKKINKTYIALSEFKPKKKQGLIKGDLDKTRGGNYSLRRTLTNPSITRFNSQNDIDSNLRLFKLFPSTGKTHQLRVVMKSLGSSIIGDSRYGGTPSDRMYLHASSIFFEYDNNQYEYNLWPKFGELFAKISPEGKSFLEDASRLR